MSPLESALLFLVLALPPFWWLQRQVAQLSDPAYLRRHGVVIVLDTAIEAHSPPIGEFMGRPIWETVTFKGMLYRFDHTIAPRRREKIEPGELYLHPGLVYVVQ
jgi:hypothetical protein